MSDSILAHEPVVRFAIFAAIFVVMAAAEFFRPRRLQQVGRVQRWPSNLAVALIDAILVRTLLPMSAVALAALFEMKGWGLLNAFAVPRLWAVPAAVMALDFVIYLQHVLFHAVPALWRLHRMHHADLEFDVTTGARFHPIEILLSMGIKFAAIAVLGAPPVAVLLFEILLNATAMFNHSNVNLPAGWDRVLRWLVVTPDMHRVHHSVEVQETNSNFGFNLPWWDRLLGTYRHQPAAGHEGMVIGVREIRDPGEQRLDRMLTQPYRIRTGQLAEPIPGVAPDASIPDLTERAKRRL